MEYLSLNWNQNSSLNTGWTLVNPCVRISGEGRSYQKSGEAYESYVSGNPAAAGVGSALIVHAVTYPLQ